MGASVLQYLTAIERWLQSVIPIFTILKLLGGLVVTGGVMWLMEAVVVPKDEYKQARNGAIAELRQLESRLETWSKMSEEQKEDFLAKEDEKERRREQGGLTHIPLSDRDVLGNDSELIMEEVEAEARAPDAATRAL